MQESIINEEQEQDYSVQEQQNPGWCIIDNYYNIAHNNNYILIAAKALHL